MLVEKLLIYDWPEIAAGQKVATDCLLGSTSSSSSSHVLKVLFCIAFDWWIMEPTISWGFIINKRLDSVRDLTRRSHSSVSGTMPGIIRFNKYIFIIIIPWRTQEMLISCMWLPKWRIYCDMLHLGWVGLRRPVDALHNIYQADSQQSPLFIWFAFVFWSLSTHNKLLHKRVNNQTAIIGFRGDKTAVDSGWINRQFN